MPTKMDDTVRPEYRIVLGSRPRALARQRHRAVIERETHGLVLHATDDGVAGGLFADWWYDLRRKQLRIYGGLLRFIDVAILRKIPKPLLKLIPQWIDAYIEEEYDSSPGKAA